MELFCIRATFLHDRTVLEIFMRKFNDINILAFTNARV